MRPLVVKLGNGIVSGSSRLRSALGRSKRQQYSDQSDSVAVIFQSSRYRNLDDVRNESYKLETRSNVGIEETGHIPPAENEIGVKKTIEVA